MKSTTSAKSRINSINLILKRCNHTDQQDLSLAFGGVLHLLGFTESFDTILDKMKLSNDMIILWLEHMKIILPTGENTRILWRETPSETLEKSSIEKSYPDVIVLNK